MFINQASEDYEYDVFISHASEDKETFVSSLAYNLREEGYRVWYDQFSLSVGNSLRRSIDRGLAGSRYGIVVISRNFLNKEWTQRELDGLTARERDGRRVILPIWHRVNRSDVLTYSPTLADRLALHTSEGMDTVVRELIRVLQQQPPPRDDLSSDHHVDYTHLRNLLKAGKWKEADDETYRLMLQVVGRREGDTINNEELSNFSRNDLNSINRLWVHYSDGRFGFSVQKRIYLDFVDGATLNGFDDSIWRSFCTRVQWIVYDHAQNIEDWINSSQVTYNRSAPEGHLPRVSLMHFNGRDVGVLIKKFQICRMMIIISPIVIVFSPVLLWGINMLLPSLMLGFLVSLVNFVIVGIISSCLERKVMNKLGLRVVSLFSHPDL